MKPQFQHQLITSFALWLDHAILLKGEAFQNIDSSFYHQPDDRLDPEFISFASPHKQWVTDSSIPNAKIINSILLNGQEIKRDNNGIRYDFNNGRVIIPRGIAKESDVVEGKYAVKDFNIYITDQTEEELLIETKFDKNSRFDQDIFKGVKPYDQVVPAIFISYEEGYNVPFAFGGQDITKSSIRCVVFAENSYQLDGLFSILKDLNHLVVANVGFNEHPLNEFGDLKFGYYDYADLSDRYYHEKNSHSTFHIDRVGVSKLNDKVAKKAHPGLYIGFIDFELGSYRFPRAELVEPQASRPPKQQLAPLAPFGMKLDRGLPNAPFGLTLDISNQNLPNQPYNLKVFDASTEIPKSPENLELSG